MQINTKNPFPMEYTIGGKQTKYNGKSKNNEVENYKFFFSSTLTDPDKTKYPILVKNSTTFYQQLYTSLDFKVFSSRNIVNYKPRYSKEAPH